MMTCRPMSTVYPSLGRLLFAETWSTGKKKELTQFEKQYGISTEQLIAGELPEIVGAARDMETWRNGYAGLLAWQQRLREYEEAYNALRR